MSMELRFYIPNLCSNFNVWKQRNTKVDRDTKSQEDLGAVIYDITNILENFGNDLKQLKENTPKRIEKLRW